MRRKMLLRVRAPVTECLFENERETNRLSLATRHTACFHSNISGDVFVDRNDRQLVSFFLKGFFLFFEGKGKSDSRLKIELKKRGGEEGLTMAMHHAKRKERRRKRRRWKRGGGGAAGTGTGDHRVIIYGVYGGSVNRKGS